MNREKLDDLDRHAYCSLETFRKSGVGVKTPVWFAADGAGHAYVFTEPDAGKVKRLRNDERIRVAPCSVSGQVRGGWLDGRARIVDDPPTIANAYRALRKKYGWQLGAVDLMSKLAGKYDKRAMLQFEVD